MELKRDKLLQNGKYRIEGVLGQGGFGITYLAVQVGLNRKVAVKEFYMKEYCERNGDASTVSMGTSGSRELVDGFKNKFVKEAQNIASFNHNNIIRIYDIFEENGTAYYVMEYHDCGSLSDYVTRKGRLSEEEAMFFIRQIADALAYIHKRKVNHLDVKPGNILLDEDKRAILIGFGLSKHYDEVGGQTTSSPVGRSKGYAPMEQYKQGGVSQFSPSTDIYSLGATMYKLVTGETPAEADEINEDGLSFPADVVLSDSVKKAIEFAMQPKRKDRPQSIDEFLRNFEVTACSKGQSDEATVIDVVDNNSVDEETVFETKEQEQERKAEEEIKRRVEAELKRMEEEERERWMEEEIKRRVEEELKRKAEEQYQLGLSHHNKKDYVKAVECFRKSAEQGNAYGQYNLALCYEKGQGVTQDIAEAMKWYKKAADNGHQDANDKVVEMTTLIAAKVHQDSMRSWSQARAAKASQLKDQTFEVKGVKFKMIAVEGGTFQMGAQSIDPSGTNYDGEADRDEKPVHSVTLSDYYIGETEVTRKLWEAVMGSNPSYFKGSQKPVEEVSWDDCKEFITKLNELTGKNFRLPTEAEWEYAARGGNKSKGYKYSGSNTIGNVAWYYDNSGKATHNVKTKSPNELGIYDMSGNVMEWCEDWKEDYSSGSHRPLTGYRVLRGGSWTDNANKCRVSYRSSIFPYYRCYHCGFRLALSQ